MAQSNHAASDLFIPVRRQNGPPPSPSTSTSTVADYSTRCAALNSPSKPIIRKKPVPSALIDRREAETSLALPSSGLRYTILSQRVISQNTQSTSWIPERNGSEVSHVPERSNAIQFPVHAAEPSSNASCIQAFSLPRQTNNSSLKNDFSCTADRQPVELPASNPLTVGITTAKLQSPFTAVGGATGFSPGISGELTIGSAQSTPFTSSQSTSSEDGFNQARAYGEAVSPCSGSSTSSTTKAVEAADVEIPARPSLSARSYTSLSSKSSKDRSYPPASFPVDFYVRYPEHREPWMIPENSDVSSSENVLCTTLPHEYLLNTCPAPVKASAAPSRQVTEEYYRPFPKPLSSPPQTPYSLDKNVSRTPSPDRTTLRTPSPQKRHPVHVTPQTSPSVQSASTSGVISAMGGEFKSEKSPTSHCKSSRGKANYADMAFYDTVHHYSACRHTSPPATRPLNVSPKLEILTADFRADRAPARSVIPGACYECDTAARRDQETRILLKYDPSISRRMNELSDLVGFLEQMAMRTAPAPSAGPFPKPNSNSLWKAAPSSTTASQSQGDTLGLTTIGRTQEPHCLTINGTETWDWCEQTKSNYAHRAHELERTIRDLTNQRNAAVKSVWKGFTSRWGPGVLGVAECTQAPSRSTSNGSQDDRTRRMHIANTNRALCGSPPPPPRKDEADRTSPGVTPSQSRNQKVRGSSRDRAWWRRGRSREHRREKSRGSVQTNTTNTSNHSAQSRITGVTYDGDSTPEGRMKVDWIR